MRWSTVLKALLVIASFTLLMGASLAAQTGAAGPKYDSTKEVKVKGVVEDFKEVPGAGEGLHLLLRTKDQQLLTVHVAPNSILKDFDLVYNKGDEVEVLGCKLEGDTPNEILAQEITKGQDTFTLRDKKGVPVWMGWRPK
jgi:hypothetical protein